MPDNLLYYGDNLDMLRRHVKDESEEGGRLVDGAECSAARCRGIAESAPGTPSFTEVQGRDGGVLGTFLP